LSHEDSFESAAGKTADGKTQKNILKSKVFKDGAIYLFVRADYKKPTWFCRIKVPKAKGYIWRSTRTTDEHVAFAFADALYHESLVRVHGGEALNAKRLGPLLESYLQHMDARKDQQSVHNRMLLIRRISPFLRTRTVNEVDTALLSEIIGEVTRLSSKDRLSPNTVRRVYSDLKHFMSWCVDEGHLTALPRFPRISGDQARRTHFDAADWRKLARYLREFTKVENKAVRRDRIMLVNYVLILANTGIRVGEARHLKWRDVRQIEGEADNAADIVLTVTGKTGPREVVARTSQVKTYLQRIYDLRVAELAQEKGSKADLPANSLVFCHLNGSPIGSFKKSFQSLIRAAGVEQDSYGQKRTIYSLRHTYATFRLHEGVHQFTLARNMGTSVAMLEQYYGHTSNVTSAAELTKSSKKRRKSEKASDLSWLR